MPASLYMKNASLEARIAKCASLRAESAVPVVVEQVGGENAKVSFTAVSSEATVMQLQDAVRRMSGVAASKPVSLLIAGCSVSATATLGDLYALCKQQDGLLYVQYSTERTMGASYNGSLGNCNCG